MPRTHYGDEVPYGWSYGEEPFRVRRDSAIGPDGHEYVFDRGNDIRTKGDYNYAYSSFYMWKSPEFDIQTAHTVDHDRLTQYHRDAYAAAVKETPSLHKYGPEQATAFLKHFEDILGVRNVRAVAMADGCNVSSGYPIYTFFFVGDPK